jgi:hypothetical protein
MLAGDPTASLIQFNTTVSGYTNFEIWGLIPADLDGSTAPPSNAPNPFVTFFDDAWNPTTPPIPPPFPLPDQLRIYNFHVDWTTPTNSTFTNATNPTTSPFDSNMCSYVRNCIPQPAPSTTPVDAMSDRLMYRLQYRNFGDHQALVLNHTVDVDGTDHAGVRWYELRNSGSGWSIHQQGTFAPDDHHRWMGSAAMNQNGDIALGYSISSGTIYPSIRVTGRFSGDPLGTMSTAEGTVVVGTGYQTSPLHRWGDYSSMSVDPFDDCTFWYTQEYYQITGNASWQTRFAAFKLRNCNPKVEIVYPKGGQIIGIPTRILVSTQNISFITTVNLIIDSLPPIDITSNWDGQYYYYDWNPSTVSVGAHTLQASVIDFVPKTTSSQTLTVTTTDKNNFLPFTVR